MPYSYTVFAMAATMTADLITIVAAVAATVVAAAVATAMTVPTAMLMMVMSRERKGMQHLKQELD